MHNRLDIKHKELVVCFYNSKWIFNFVLAVGVSQKAISQLPGNNRIERFFIWLKSLKNRLSFLV